MKSIAFPATATACPIWATANCYLFLQSRDLLALQPVEDLSLHKFEGDGALGQ